LFYKIIFIVTEESNKINVFIDLIMGLPESVKNKTELENVKQRFMTMLDRYQEQPHLVDQYLPKMLAMLVEAVLNPASEGKFNQ